MWHVKENINKERMNIDDTLDILQDSGRPDAPVWSRVLGSEQTRDEKLEAAEMRLQMAAAGYKLIGKNSEQSI